MFRINSDRSTTRSTRRWHSGAVFAAVTTLLASVTGCGADSSEADTSAPLVIMASTVPHTEILKRAEEAGLLGDVKLEIKEQTGDIDPNQLLAAGDIDANFFQHVPYEKSWATDHKVTDFVDVATVHVEPLGIYSKKTKKLADTPEGSTVALSNNVSNFARGLFLLQQAGLLTLDVKATDPDLDFSQVTEKNIVDNPKDLKFVQVDPAQLPSALDDGKVELSIINGNYALEAGLEPAKDALELETAKDNPYANVVTVKKKLENDPRVKKLAKALQSKEIADWIEKTYKGSVIPVNG